MFRSFPRTRESRTTSAAVRDPGPPRSRGRAEIRSPIASEHASAGRLDVRRLDDRRPLFGLGLVIGAEALRRLLLGGRKLLADIGEVFLYGRAPPHFPLRRACLRPL